MIEKYLFQDTGAPRRIRSGSPIEKKTEHLNMRVPKQLLDAVKKRARARGIPYTRFVREAMETALAEPVERRRR